MITYPNTKINLGLHVIRRRPDGYHDIETVFVPYFGLRDALEVVRGDDFGTTLPGLAAKYGGDRIRQGIAPDGKCMITVAREEGVDWDPADDLCVRAYRELDRDFGLPPVKIFLEKLAPVGAGLGSGSADAAFTLRMLSEMFGLGLGDEALASYAARVGSDCAFFVWNRPMEGRGRGEILTPIDLPALEEYDLRVVAPTDIHVGTAAAYRGVIPREDRPAASPRTDSAQGGAHDGEPPLSLEEALRRPVAQWKDVLVNDFEPSVFAQFPRLAEIKGSLYASGAVYACMSGSGSALYGLYLK